MMMLPAAASEVIASFPTPALVYSGGFRNPCNSVMLLSLPSSFLREIVSVSIECPKR